jgi:hypothetical protein
MAQKPRIGDVVEISTRKGRAYAQYTHEKDRRGSVLRILPGLHQDRPRELGALVRQYELYFVFFPLKAAVTRGIFPIIGHEDVPERVRPFPIFRSAGAIDRKGKVHDWWLSDGDREWRVERLTDEQRALSVGGIWNDTLLIQRIEEGWTPATDPRSQDA